MAHFDPNDWLLVPALLIGSAALLGALAFRLRRGLPSSNLGALLHQLSSAVISRCRDSCAA